MENEYIVLRRQIEHTRSQMILLGQQYGLASLKTIQESQRLDELLNRLHYLESEKMAEYRFVYGKIE
ncbi:MAG TPA: aspartyl-phosphate phosphatase Spo0E family protein [Bacillus sp. (in: firmicutes)]|nr:aspartyl-phosphate phosphatase Spo0E family protein [Bacillus sp. (in: firmicutes)]